MRIPVNTLFKWLNKLAIIALLLAYCSPFVNPTRVWFFSFFGTAYSWILLVNILFVIFWIIRKRWYFVWSFLVIALGWSFLTTFIGLNFSNPKPKEGAPSFRVMGYNTEGFRMWTHQKEEATRKQHQQQFFEWLNQSVMPDILCTQETGWQQLITDQSPLKYHTRHHGVAIFSKYPLLERGNVPFPNTHGNACVWADVKLPDGTIVRVYSTHLQSNRVSADADRLRKKPDLDEKETWLGIKSMLDKYRYAAQRRVEQTQLILQHTASCPYPYMVAGDFNEMPLSYIYRLFAQQLQDTFQTAALGLGTTFSGSIPGLKLDYLFVTNDIRVLDHHIIKKPMYSDHYPVVSTLLLKK